MDCIYLDFAKAFDSVPHQRLLRKVYGYGIRGKLITWVRSFLIDRRQRVSTHVLSGIPHGSVLGPLLFIIFINDTPEIVNSIIKMFRTVNREADSTVLQIDLIALQEWSNKWQMKCNADKCKIFHIGGKNPNRKYFMTQCGIPVELHETKLEKDLGIHLDPELNFSQHYEKQVNKGNKMLGLIRRTYSYFDAESVTRLYTSLIRPHLE